MKFGIVPREWGYFYNESIEQCILAKKVGFDSIWIEEHHGNELYLPSPITVLAGLSQHVRGMEVGTAIAVLPLYHPVRFAADGAILDILSGGKFIAGVAAGYREHEFKIFGVDLKERAGRMNESLEIISRLWQGEQVNFNGRYFNVNNFRLEPQPVQKPRPPIWVGGWVENAIERAAKWDLWFPGPVGSITYVTQALEKYKIYLAKYGKKFEGFALMRETHVAENDEVAFKNIEEPIKHMYGEDYSKSEHPLLGNEGLTIQEWAEDRFIVGSPSSVIEQVDRLKKLGVKHLVLRISLRKLTHQKIMDSIRLFGEKVIPYFKAGES
jgi:alkanesulfonate monooxygenase SsuD/methylene tetrahydromethanopterin reductase-like flavin-dependent oxidoreductase (luciferase family)